MHTVDISAKMAAALLMTEAAYLAVGVRMFRHATAPAHGACLRSFPEAEHAVPSPFSAPTDLRRSLIRQTKLK